MPIVVVDNFDVNVGKNIDSRFGPYNTEADANAAISSIFRFKALTVLITGSGQNVEYWYNPTIADGDLVPKTAAAVIGGVNEQVVFYSGSAAISGSPSFSFDYGSSHLFVTGSTTLSGSVFVRGATSESQNNVVTIDTATGKLHFTASNALSAVSTPLDIQKDTTLVKSGPTFINFTGSGVIATANGAGVDIEIPGGGIGTPGGDNTQIQFNGSGVFSGSSNFTFISSSNTVILTGSMFVSGAISASLGPNTVGFFGTASFAVSASHVSGAFMQGGNSFGTEALLGTNDTQNLSLETGGVTRIHISSSGMVIVNSGTTPHFAGTSIPFQVSSGGSANGIGFRTNILYLYPYTTTTNANTASILFGASGQTAWTVRSLGTGSFQIRSNPGSSTGTALIHLVSGSSPRIGILTETPQHTLDVSGSARITGSFFLPGITSSSYNNVLIIDTGSGQVYVTASSAIGGGAAADIAISGSSIGLTPTVTSIDFTGAGVTATTVGNAVTVTIPGGGGTPGGLNTQIQFNSASVFSGSTNFTFDYVTNSIGLTGSMIISGSTILTGSMFITGAISASFGPNTVGFHGTASYSQTASFVTASNVFGPFGSNSVISASLATTASYVTASNVFGPFESNSVISASLATTASYATGSIFNSTNLALSASFAQTASFALTASYVTASNVFGPFGSNSVISASSATTASYVTGSIFNSTNLALSASYALTASYAANAAFNSTSSIIGDNSALFFNIDHNFNTRNLHVTVYSASATYETVYPDVERTTVDRVKIVFGAPPTIDQYVVYISQ